MRLLFLCGCWLKLFQKNKQILIILVVKSFKQDMFDSTNNQGLLLPKILHKKLPQMQNVFAQTI